MKKLTKQQIKQINELLEKGQALPEEYKNLLFETKKEYELVYDSKEREEDIIAETMSVPLQPAKTFGSGRENEWINKLIFGDNLQVLKTFYNDPDIKGHVNLIYIDPPFGTGDIYSGRGGEPAYSAKLMDVKFINSLRRRLILLRELLSPDGSFFMRIDYHFGHYMKVILDEVFDKENFQNEIIINRFKRMLKGLNRLNVATDNIFFYTKSNNFYFNPTEKQRTCSFCGSVKEPDWRAMSSPGLRKPPERKIFGKIMLPPKGRHWTYTQEAINRLVAEDRIRINKKTSYTDIKGKKIVGMPEYLQTESTPIDSNWTDLKGYVFGASYPTENPEELLERIIRISSREGDLVLDCYAGSGATLAVAEKLNRRWVGVDSSKLAIYTIQKRMLNLKTEIGNKGKTLKPKPFTVYNAGLYDYKMIKGLPWDEYRDFALKLFQCRDEKHKVSGIELDGYLGEDHVLTFKWHDGNEIVLDRGFIDDLHKAVGKKVGRKFFIVAPASTVVFLEDYIEKDDVKYYILRIPYSVIEEIHEKGFESIKQPISVAGINEVIDAVGFDFIQIPDVECQYNIQKISRKQKSLFEGDKEAVVKIKKFKSNILSRKPVEFKNLETLSMVMMDYDFDGDVFDMDAYWFAEDIARNKYQISFDPKKVDKQMMIVYMDIFGNEKREIKTLRDFKK